jgi:propanediol dehydratase small subunit
MMDQQNLEKMITDVLAKMLVQSGGAAPAGSGGRVTYRDYPLGEKSVDKLKTPTGKSIKEVTLDAVLAGKIASADVRITAETLEMQAQVADSVGRKPFAANLRRAAELIAVPDARILEMYDALRPYHATKEQLLSIAEELQTKYNAQVTARLVREAAEVGAARGRLKKAA